MTHYIFVTMKPAKTNRCVKSLALLGIGYIFWSEVNRRMQEEKIRRLSKRLDELVDGEGE